MEQEFLDEIIEKYNPDFAFAYGSGAFHQKDQPEAEQIDFIFGVEDPYKWHLTNLENNPEDYSWLGKHVLKNRKLFDVVQDSGAGIWYHTFVPFQGKEIKYGVISLEDLRSDLQNWDTLYLAGRMHKPINVFKHEGIEEEQIKQNRLTALNVALLTLNNTFSRQELYETITGISYIGDSRMTYGEDPNKVRNITLGNLCGFDETYEPLFEEVGILKNGDELIQSQTPYVIYESLPDSIKKGRTSQEFFSGEKSLSNLYEAITSIVNKPTKVQTRKGIITAGLKDSIRYARAKIQKRFSQTKNS